MTAERSQPQSQSFAAMCLEEPFRVFFPLGMLNGIAGLALWPLYFGGLIEMYPAAPHARIMVEGFAGAFIAGFLGTAGPRLLETRHFTGIEIGALLALHVAASAAHLAGYALAGDMAFAAFLLVLVAALARRFAVRKDSPPPSFVLAAGGLFCGLAGAACFVFSSIAQSTPRLYLFGQLALTQGFVLLPLFGVGVFFFSRFFRAPVVEGQHKGAPNSSAPLMAAVLATFVTIGSFAMDAVGGFLPGAVVRFCALAFYAASQMPFLWRPADATPMGNWIRVAVLAALFGLVWPAVLPATRVAGLHMIFIGGVTMSIFVVATRVMLGHSGQIDLCRKPLRFLTVSLVLLLASLGARIGADFMPTLTGRNRHLVWASMLGIAAMLVWGARLAPRARIPDSDT